jgi:plasmid stability protein
MNPLSVYPASLLARRISIFRRELKNAELAEEERRDLLAAAVAKTAHIRKELAAATESLVHLTGDPEWTEEKWSAKTESEGPWLSGEKERASAILRQPAEEPA